MIYEDIENLVLYGISTALIDPLDVVYIYNTLLALLGVAAGGSAQDAIEREHAAEHLLKTANDSNSIDNYKAGSCALDIVLGNIVKYAVEKGLCADTKGNSDAFDSALMGVLTPRPAIVIKKVLGLI